MKYFIIALILSILYSCEKEIKLDQENFEPQLVLNCLMDTSFGIKMQVSKTSVMTDSGNFWVNNATVGIWENDIYMGDLISSDSGMYQSAIQPKAGNIYSMSVSCNGFQTIYARDTIPYPVSINNGSLVSAGTDNAGDPIFEFSVNIDDPPGITNYYQLIFSTRQQYSDAFSQTDTMFIFYSEKIYTSSDPVLLAEGDLDYHPQTLFFSDKMFDGKNQKITARIMQAYMVKNILISPPGSLIYVELHSISYSYYQYLKKWTRHLYNQGISLDVRDSEELREFLFTGEPVNMYSNIENGYGIFAGRSKSTYALYGTE